MATCNEANATLFNSEDQKYKLTPEEMDELYNKFTQENNRKPEKKELQDLIEAKINKKMAESLSDNQGARDKMINWVENQPHYTQCILHIEAYRNYHKAEKEEFVQRIQVIDERYAIYGNCIDRIQISIILLSAIAAFIQAGNTVIGFSDVIIQFITLCVSSYSALVLSIAKYYKLDEQKESMNNLRNQCADLVGELGAREDRLNTLCFKELWAGPPGAPAPPVLDAWKNERAELFTSLKSIIQKKQTLVSIFNQIIDSSDSRKLMLRARRRTVKYKQEKYKIGKDEIDLIEWKNLLKRRFKEVNRYNEDINGEEPMLLRRSFPAQTNEAKLQMETLLKKNVAMAPQIPDTPAEVEKKKEKVELFRRDIEANIIVDSSFNTVNP